MMSRKSLVRYLFGLGIVCMLCHGGSWGIWAQMQTQSALSGKKIAIDVGHGGIDSGAQYFGLAEKEINLCLARQLGELLTEAGAEVSYTRTEDVDYYTRGKGGKRADLTKRIAMIEQMRADVFISIHCNAASHAGYRGAQVFYHPRREDNAFLAMCIQRELSGIDPNNRRQAAENTRVLLLSSLSPVGVLVEAGYLSNEAEARLLADESYQRRLAACILQGLFRYFAEKSA